MDDLAVIITSDHGEAFGEHGLYLHDASLYDCHLHVPLYVWHPEATAERVDDVVSLRDLYGLVLGLALRDSERATLLDAEFRMENGLAIAQHFHYTEAPWMAEKYRHNQSAAILPNRKLLLKGGQVEAYDLVADPGEETPEVVDRALFSLQWPMANADAPALSVGW